MKWHIDKTCLRTGASLIFSTNAFFLVVWYIHCMFRGVIDFMTSFPNKIDFPEDRFCRNRQCIPWWNVALCGISSWSVGIWELLVRKPIGDICAVFKRLTFLKKNIILNCERIFLWRTIVILSQGNTQSHQLSYAYLLEYSNLKCSIYLKFVLKTRLRSFLCARSATGLLCRIVRAFAARSNTLFSHADHTSRMQCDLYNHSSHTAHENKS